MYTNSLFTNRSRFNANTALCVLSSPVASDVTLLDDVNVLLAAPSFVTLNNVCTYMLLSASRSAASNSRLAVFSPERSNRVCPMLLFDVSKSSWAVVMISHSCCAVDGVNVISALLVVDHVSKTSPVVVESSS